MSHYFTFDGSLKPDERKISYNFAGRSYVFTTDSGVFSKEHIDPATEILLTNLPPLKGSLLDLGCGYGCIGIMLSGAYSLELTQADINPRALELTKRNCEENGIVSHIVESDCFSNIEGSFDTITLNPPIHAGKAVTYRMFAEAREHLREGGRFYIVTLKKHGAESTFDFLSGIYKKCDIIYKKKGYYLIAASDK